MFRCLLLAIVLTLSGAFMAPTTRVPTSRTSASIQMSGEPINESIDKENPKVVTVISVTDLLEDKGTVKVPFLTGLRTQSSVRHVHHAMHHSRCPRAAS